MLTNRCSFKLSKILKKHNFPQNSFIFDSDYYTDEGELVFNKEESIPDLTFAPLICEVIDRFDIDLNLNLTVSYYNDGFQYRIYDAIDNVEITSNLKNEDLPSRAYELCILDAIKYYDSKKAGTKTKG